MCGILLRNGCTSVKFSSLYSLLNVHKSIFLVCFSTQKKAHVDKKEFILQSKYNPKDVESQWYEWWESKNYFKPTKSENDSFVILLPPPNITGTLHLGHALTTTIQDVILRWKRMKGESVLWIPGVDHAGIATQVAVEKYLKQSKGLSRHNLGKEEFLKRIWEWKVEKEETITDQIRKMGASLDWSCLKFTMDPTHCNFVTDSFIQLYNQGLIYRAESLVNWSCVLKTTISDIEVDWIDIEKRTKLNVPGYEKPIDFGTLYEFAYKVCDEDDEIIVSTTRPETMLGDVAVAVHPDNPVHSRFRNKQLWHPFRNVRIPVIFDDFVNMSMGSGAVKITPAHSLIDFNVALKHDLKAIPVINEDGLIEKVGSVEKFHGLKRFDARSIIINELKSLGLFRNYKVHAMKVPVCSRSGDIVELILKNQWFLNCKQLAEKALDSVKNGDLKLEPERYNIVWYEWLNKIKDWNLSRQLWWGHQIPMYKCKRGNKSIWVAGRTLEEAKLKATEIFKTAPDAVVQDSDVLDTWFSSGLLPLNMFSEKVQQTKRPPISLMVTGHDILFFWVARMVMLSIQLTGELPFNHVFLHGLVSDPKGRKMSKSLGNVIHPEDVMNGCSPGEMKALLEKSLQQGLFTEKDFQQALESQKKMYPNGIPECGADSLRLTLCSRDLSDESINFDVDTCQAIRHFCNKVWQAVNYFIKITDNYKALRPEFDLLDIKSEQEGLNCFDRWILSRLGVLAESVDVNIAVHKFYLASQAIRLYFVEEFCDVYLESSKSILREASPLQYKSTVSVFFNCLETFFRSLSPFMPFLSEHLYQSLPLLNGFDKLESVTVAQFPDGTSWSEFRDPDLDCCFEKVSKLLTNLRRTKTLFHLTEKRPNAFIKCSDDLASILFGSSGQVFGDLGGVGIVDRVAGYDGANVIVSEVSKECTVFIEHNHDKDTLISLLNPSISKEEKVKVSLDKLMKTTSSAKWEEMTPSEKGQVLRKISGLEKDLKKIQQFKQAIKTCNR